MGRGRGLRGEGKRVEMGRGKREGGRGLRWGRGRGLRGEEEEGKGKMVDGEGEDG